MGVFTLAMINVSAIVSLRGLPAESTYGLSSAFYYIFAAIFFLIPVSLVAAELTTGWPQKGGVFRWVGEAFGTRFGFLAIWLQWIESTIWFPTVLTFAAVSIAFVGPNQSWDEAVSANDYYVLIMVLLVYWAATLLNFRGMSMSGAITKWGTLIGTVIPAALLVLMGLVYWASGNALDISMAPGEFFPDLTNFNNIVLAASIFLFYAGMEMSAVHVKDVDNPGRNYPKAIFIASVMTVAIFVLGTLAIGFIIPESQINLVQSLLVAFDKFFAYFEVPWLGPAMAVCLAFGVLAQVVAWVGGPSKGLLQVGCAGYLPPFMQKTNKRGVQVGILLLQGGVVTLLSIFFVVLPSVQTAYQIISQLTIILYLIMYLLMFAAGIYLRYREPDTPRSFRIPGGKFGMWLVGGLGLLGSVIAFVLSFVPPSQIPVGSPAVYVGILIVGMLVFAGIPFIIYAMRRPEWADPRSVAEFEPFGWEKAGRGGASAASSHHASQNTDSSEQ
ncbi:MAG TPA: amino acid permease [Candidatus Akkermansia intestinigallinarum]|uniref:Amino acid permease n=1 Tax=Candidatus Akkermansia intestinigallinarum TaxID=2838431 RepID=A0A9D1VAN0_9BACT|nr:amino acid permease [Candidatus Akkermansia intestinigallinarum]